MRAAGSVIANLQVALFRAVQAGDLHAAKAINDRIYPTVRAFFQAVKELEDEGGVEARHDRYRENHAALVEGMRRSGFRTLLPDELQSPIITSFLYPEEDFDFQKFYEALKERGFVIYPGKISEAPTFRIGNIGDVFPDDFRRLAEAVADIRRNK